MQAFRHKLKIVTLWASAIFLSLAVLFLAFSIVTYYVLLYPPLQEKVLRVAEKKLSEYIVGDVTIERFESNLLSYIDLHGVRAVGKSAHGDSVYVGHITVRYWVPSLVRRRVNVTYARVTDVRAHVVMEKGNNIMLPFIPLYLVDSSFHLIGDDEPRKQTSDHIPNPANWAVHISLGQAEVNGISAVYRDLANDMVGEIVNASATARFHTLDSFTVALRVPRGASYRSPWWNGAIDTIGASAVVTWKRLYVNSLLLKGSGTHVTAGSGVLSYFPDGPWDLKADFITSIRPVPILYEHSPQVGRDGYLEGTASFGGKLYEPIYKAQVKGFGITYDNYRIDHLDVDASYGRDEYGRARIRGMTAFGEFDVNASILMKNLMEGPQFGGYSVSAVLAGLDAEKIANELRFELPLPIDTGNVRLSASGRCVDTPDFFEFPDIVEVSAELDGARLAGGDIAVNAVLKKGSDWVLDGNWGLNRVEGKGSLDIVKGAISGSVEADIPDPSPAAMIFAKERARGRLEARAEFSGRFEDFENVSISANVKGDGIRWRGVHADSVEAHLTVDSGKVRLHRADGRAWGRVDSVAAFFGLKNAGGHVDADFAMKGGLDDLVLSARVRARELRYDAYALDTLSGFATMEDGVVRWNDLYLRGMGTSMHSRGRLTIGADMEVSALAEIFNEQGKTKLAAGKLDVNGVMKSDSTISATCRVTSVPLDLFDPWIPEEHRMKGVVSVSGDFSGTVANPAARVNFKLMNPSYSTYEAFSVIGDAALADSLVTAAALLRVDGKSETVEIKARLPFLPSSGWLIDTLGTRVASVSAGAKGQEVSEVSLLTALIEPDLRISGRASFSVEASNSGSGWVLGGKLTLPEGTVQYAPADITVGNVELNASVGGTLENPLVDFIVTSGRAHMPPLRVDRCFIKGRTGIDTLVIDSARIVVRDTGFVDLRAKMVYSAAAADSLFYGQNFYAQYRVTNFPPGFFSRLVQGASLRNGHINGSGVVYAAEGRPLMSGTLALDGLDFIIQDIYPTIGPVSARLKFADSTVTVASMNAKWGRGFLSAGGRVFWNMEKLHDMDLRVRGSDLFFELPEVINVGLSRADLRMNDQNENIVISGKVNMGPTSYVRDLNFLELINQAQIGSDVRRAPNPFLESILLHIDVDLADNMSVDMNLGSLTMDGRITVAGTVADPSFVGRITISDGYVYYLDRKFHIKEGSLFNPDLSAINPTLGIIAELDVITFSSTSRAEQFTITLSLTGTLENPVVRFTAAPALSELDILSILTFGERMGGMGSDIQNRLTNIAAQQVLGIGARRLEKLLNLDRVSVSGNVMGGTGDGQNDGITIGTTKRLSSRLNVTYEINTGKQINQKATAQYRLHRNFFLEGQTTSVGENSVNLTYRYSK